MREHVLNGKKAAGRAAALLLAAVLILSGVFCVSAADSSSVQEEEQGKNITIYYLNEDGNGLYPLEISMADGDLHARLQTLFQQLAGVPEKTPCQPLLPPEVIIRSYSFSSGLLTLDFSKEYQKLESTREVLARAGIVRTLVQLDEIDYIRFTIGGKDAVNGDGLNLGIMNADSFVEDAGKTINAIQHTQINLYFASKKGDSLNLESRSIYYSASKPLEWAIVERIIAGPLVEGNYPTVPATLQIMGVTCANGVCFVNLNQTFEVNQLSVDEKIPIYSIVNSICDNCPEVKEVQFAIDGDSNVIFRQNMDLSKTYRADMTLVNM